MKKRLLSILVIVLVAMFIPTMVKAEEKDVWIDNTVDKSTTEVKAVLKIKDLKTEEETSTTIYDEKADSAYSNSKNETVEEMIKDAKEALISKAKEYKEDFDSETIVENETNGKMWDNRKYETIEDDDAVLIGDTEYITGANSGTNPSTRTHIASGDYGLEHIITIEAYVEVSGEEEVELEILEGADQTYVKGSNKDIVIVASGALEDLKGIEIDNGNPISEDNMELSDENTTLTLKAAFLEASSVGEHTITFKYDADEVETKLIIVEKEEEKEPVFKVTYDFNGGVRQGEKEYVDETVAIGLDITKENFVDKFGVTPPEGMELEAIEINGTKTELGSDYLLNKDTVFKYIWKELPKEEEKEESKEEETKEEPVKEETKADTATGNNEVNPQTGDNISLYISILGLSIICLLGSLVYLKKVN